MFGDIVLKKHTNFDQVLGRFGGIQRRLEVKPRASSYRFKGD